MKRHVERLRLIRIGVDDTSLRVAPVNLTRMIEHILIALEPAATEGDGSLRMEVPSLTQPVPGTEVVAELTLQNGVAMARISDTGKGMSQNLVTRIFDECARDGGAGAPRGTGMGLYIAKMLTELHGGTIKVESEPGEGSVFSVGLPLDGPKS